MAEGEGIRKPKRKGAGTKVDFRAGKEGGQGSNFRVPRGRSRQSFVPVFRGFRVDSSTSFRENLPSWKITFCWRCSNYFIPFYLFDSVSVLRTIIFNKL